MEAGRPIHYHRNTVIVPKLGAKSRHQMIKHPRRIVVDNNKIPKNRSPKVCSTLVCPRCAAEQTKWRATCRRCLACFYCGLVGGRAFQCHFCGNYIPDEDREITPDRSMKIT